MAAAEGSAKPLDWGQVICHAPVHVLGRFLDRKDFVALQTTSPRMQESVREILRARNEELPEELRMVNLGGAFNVRVILKELLKREGRHPLDIIATGGIITGRGAVNTVRSLDMGSGLVAERYTTLAPMSRARCGHATAVLNGKLYVIGGFSYGHLSSVECLDLEIGQWTAVAPLGIPRSSAGAAVLGGKIFVVGGFNRGQFLSSVESFDPATGQWTTVTPLNIRRGGNGVVSAQGKLYAVGGEAVNQQGAESLASVECFDPATGVWTIIAAMNEARKDLGVAVLGDKLLAIGGDSIRDYDQGYLSSVECLDLAVPSSEWTPIAPMTMPRGNFGVAVTGGKVYAIGGGGKGSTSDSMECFDPYEAPAGQWTVMSENPSFQVGASFAAC